MRIATASGVVSAIPSSSTLRAIHWGRLVADLTVHRRLGRRLNAVTRSSGLDPHTLTLDRIPNRNDPARI